MFRISKIFLIILTTGICFILFFNLIREYDKEIIPDATNCVQVNTDNQKYTKKEIFSKLTELSNKNNYQLDLVRLLRLNGKSTKIIYSFNKKRDQVYSFYKRNNIKELNKKDVQLEDIRGKYYTNADNSALSQLRMEMNRMGLNYSIYKVSPKNVLNNSIVRNYVPIVLSVFSLVLIIMFIEKISRFKEYAILKLNGFSLNKIIIRDIKNTYLWLVATIAIVLLIGLLYASFLMNRIGIMLSAKYLLMIAVLIALMFIILDLVSYSSLYLISVYSAIQGKSYSREFVVIGYILKLCLVGIVAINIFYLHNQIQNFIQDQKVMKMWINHHSGYVLQFSEIGDKDKRLENTLGRSTRKLINSSKDVIISRNSQEFHPAINDIIPENGNVLFINKNYLNYNYISGINQYAINKNYLNIFIPDTRINQKNKVLKEFRNFLKFQDSLSGTHRSVSKKRINTIIYTGHKKIFNYTVGKNISDSISTDPIIVLDNGVLSDNFYFSTATQGMVQFGDLKELQNNLKKFSLEPYITGITNAKSRWSEFNVNMSRQIFLIILITLISISQLILVIIFISLSFLQRKRLKMTINKIFGQSNRKLIFNFCFFNIGSDGLVIFILIALEQQRWQMGLTMFPYLIVEFFVVIILAKIAQRNLLTTLNSGN